MYTTLVQCTDIAADRCQGHRSAAISVHLPKAVHTVKSVLEDGRVCCPKHVKQIQLDRKKIINRGNFSILLVAYITEFKNCVEAEIGLLHFPAIHEHLTPLPRYCVVDDLPSHSSAVQTNTLAPKY